MSKKIIIIMQILQVLALTLAATPKLDRNFGVGGIVFTDFLESTSAANAAAIQADGKLVLAGYSCLGTRCSIAVARYKHDGNLDETFGTAGKVLTRIGRTSIGTSLGLQQDGKLVIGGMDCRYECQPLVIRYNRDGTIDATFGKSGIKAIANGGFISSLLVQPDQKILAAGSWGSSVVFSLARFNADGSEDPHFGRGGQVQTAVTYDDYDRSVYPPHIALQNDGKIVAAGGNGFFGAFEAFNNVVIRYDPNGNIDRTFGPNGIIRTRFTRGPFDFASQVLFDRNQILLTGTSAGRLVMFRYKNDGQLDRRFGKGGKRITNLYANAFSTRTNDQDINVAAVKDGTKIISSGYSCGPYLQTSCLVVFRLHHNGQPDKSFGNNGEFQITQLKGRNIVSKLLLTTEHKLLLAGCECGDYGKRCKFLVARLNLD